MADYKVVLTAGTQIEIAASGSYYRILDASDDVWIGVDGGPLQKRSAGIGEHVADGFSRLALFSNVDQTVILSVTRGRVDDNRLTLTKGAIVQVDNGVLNQGIYSVGVASSAAGGSLEVVAPAANTNGIRVYGFFTMYAPSERIFLYAATGNVGVFTDVPMICEFDPSGFYAAPSMPVKIPAGMGIYIGTSNSAGGILVACNTSLEIL